MKVVQLIVLSALLACSPTNTDDLNLGSVSNNYVIKYITAEQFYFSVNYVRTEPFSILFEVNFLTSTIINKIKPQSDQMIIDFNSFARMNKDTSFNKPIAACFPYPCIANGGNTISVTCNQSYLKHTSGSILNDLFQISFYSAKEFVESNYPPYEGIIPEAKRYLYMPLNDFNINQSLMASAEIKMHLQAKPEENGVYVFYFRYTDNSAIKHIDSVRFEYDEFESK